MDRLQQRLCAALKDHLATGRTNPPEGAALLWNAFASLSLTRTHGPNGPGPVTFAEISAWARLMRVPLEPGHVEIIRAMDEIWLRHARSRRDPPPGTKVLPPVSKHALSATLLDVMTG